MKNRVSFIVPIYNCMNIVNNNRLKCFDSILDQEGDFDVEIVAVDDCSTDGSYDLLLSYQEEYRDIFVAAKNKTNRRAGGARNNGIAIASGNWIAFVDQDDWLDKSFVDKLIRRALETEADVVGCFWNIKKKRTDSIEYIDEFNYDGIVGQSSHETKRKMILEYGGLLSKIFKKEVLNLVKEKYGEVFPEGIRYEDNAAGMSIMLEASCCEMVPEPLYCYCSSADSVTSVITEQSISDRLDAELIGLKRAKSNGSFELYYDEYERTFLERFYGYTYSIIVAAGWKSDTIYSYVNYMLKSIKREFPSYKKSSYWSTISWKYKAVLSLNNISPRISLLAMRIFRK